MILQMFFYTIYEHIIDIEQIMTPRCTLERIMHWAFQNKDIKSVSE